MSPHDGKKMEVDHETGNVCLCHNLRWRAKYQYLSNKLRRYIQPHTVQRIPRTICTCDPTDLEGSSQKRQQSLKVLNPRWLAVQDESFTAAKTYFDHFIAKQDPCEQFQGYLKIFRDLLVSENLLSDHQSSANRFLYVIHQLIEQGRCDLMDPIVTNPQTRKIHKVVFILSALRPRDVGNFIGRSGVKLQKLAAKGSKIDIVVNEGTKQVEAHIVCSAQAVESLKKKMEEAAVELRKKRDAHEIRVEKFCRGMNQMADYGADDSNDDMEDGGVGDMEYMYQLK